MDAEGAGSAEGPSATPGSTPGRVFLSPNGRRHQPQRSMPELSLDETPQERYKEHKKGHWGGDPMRLLRKLGLMSPAAKHWGKKFSSWGGSQEARDEAPALEHVSSQGPVRMNFSSGVVVPLDGVHLIVGGEADDEADALEAQADRHKDFESAIIPGEMATGLPATALEQLAYTVFLAGHHHSSGSTGPKAHAPWDAEPADLVELVELCLQVDGCAAGATRGLLREMGGLSSNFAKRDDKVGTMRLPVSMLGVGRACHFSRWTSFLRWRHGWTDLLEEVMVRRARMLRSADAPGAARSLARLAGGLRRMNVVSEDEYDQEEYAAAVAFVQEAVASVAEISGSHHRQQQSSDDTSSRLYPTIDDPKAGTTEWELPLEIRVAVAKRLMDCMFDDLEEDEIIEDKDELLAVLRNNVWPIIGITAEMDAAIYAWAFYTQYLTSGSDRVYSECIDACAKAKQMCLSADDDEQNSETTALLCPSVVATIQESVADFLSDYHERFRARGLEDSAPPAKMAGLLGILESVTPEEDQLTALVSSIVRKSAITELSRTGDKYASKTCRAMLAATEAVVKIVKEENNRYAPLLSRSLPSARQVSAETIHQCFGRVLQPVFHTTNLMLNPNTLALAQLCDSLDRALLRQKDGEEFVLREVTHQFGDREPPGSWDIMGSLLPTLESWVDANIATLPTWVDRLSQNEKWRAVPGSDQTISGNAKELLRITQDTLEQLLGMGLRIPAKLIRSIMDTLGKCSISFCAGATEDLRASHFPPPVPRLTRYKDKVITRGEKREQTAAAQAPMKATPSRPEGNAPELVAPVPILEHSIAPSPSRNGSSPPTAAKREGMDPTTITVEDLALRINSLAHIRDHLPQYVGILEEKWLPYGAWQSPGGSSPVAACKAFTESLTEDAIHRVELALDDILRFFAAKVIYVDLRQEIFGRLYRWHVGEARMATLLGSMNNILGDLVMKIEDLNLRDLAALHLLRESVQAVLRVLLDGGAARTFAVTDAAMIDEDVEMSLRALFYADGDGLDLDTVNNELRPISDVLTLMGCESDDLLQRFEGLETKPTYHLDDPDVSMPPYPTHSLATNSDVLLRVLCHRADRTCSKLLKEEYHLPRGEESKETFRAKTGGFRSAFRIDKFTAGWNDVASRSHSVSSGVSGRTSKLAKPST